MAYDVGTAVIHVNVAFEGIERQLRNLAEKIGKNLNDQVSDHLNKGLPDSLDKATKKADVAARRNGANLGETIGDGVSKGISRGAKKGLDQAAREAERQADTIENNLAHAFTGAYARRVRGAAERAFGSLPTLQPGVDIGPGTEQMRRIRSDLLGLLNGDADFLISEQGLARLKELRSELGQLKRDVEQPRQIQIDAEAAEKVIDGLFQTISSRAERAAKLQLEREAGLRALASKRAATEARRAYDDLQRSVSRATARLADERQRAAEEQVKREEAVRLASLKKVAQAAKQSYDDLQRGVDRATKDLAREAQQEAKEAERAFDATWAARVRKQIVKAYESIPDLTVDADTTPARRRLSEIRADLARLSDAKIGIDVSVAEAMAELTELRRELTLLARNRDVTVDVQADTVAAAAALTAVDRLADRLSNRRVSLSIEAGGSQAVGQLGQAASVALSRLEGIIATSVSLGTVLVPAAAAAASAIGFIGTAAASAGAGIGAMALGFFGVGDAVKAMQQYADDAAKSQVSLSRASNAVASATDAITSAQRSLANTRAANADGARRAAQAVEDAERGVARAQEEARRATLDLIRAREEERRANQDLAFDLEGLAISQRQAILDQADAKRELDRVLANPRATLEQREQAQITYDEISLRLRELAVQQERAAERQREATRTGIEGSERVQAAHRQVRAAVEGVGDAQRRVSEARAAQAAQARQAAFAVAQAQQALTSAMRAQAQAVARDSVAGGEALDNLRTAMDKLSPAGQRFATFIFGLRDEFLQIRDASAEGLLPGVQAALTDLLPVVPRVADFFGRVGRAVGNLARETVRFLRSDRTWRQFWQHMDEQTVPMLERLWRLGRDAATGLAGLVLAIEPFNEDIGGGLEKLVRRFSEWAATLKHNPSFQNFLAYVRSAGPRVVDLIGELVTFVGRFVAAAAPTGALVVTAFAKLFELLNAIPMPILQGLVLAMAVYAGVLLLVNTRTRLLAIHTALQTRMTTLMGNATARGTGALRAYHAAAVSATITTGQFGGALTALNTGANLARRGLGAVVAGIGRMNIAIAAATLVITELVTSTMEHNAAVDNLARGLKDLADAHKGVGQGGRQSAAATRDALQAVADGNSELQQAVVLLQQLGISFETLDAAASGSQPDVQKVLQKINEQIALLEKRENAFRLLVGGNRANLEQLEQLRQLRDALQKHAGTTTLATNAQEAMNAAQGRSADLARIFATIDQQGAISSERLLQKQSALAQQYDANATKIQVLQGLVDAFGDAQSTAAEKADALRAAIELQTQSAISAIEAEEKWNTELIDLGDSVASNRQGLAALAEQNGWSKAQVEKFATSLSTSTREGLRNRDALESAASATRDLFLADIESGVPMDQATKRHQERIKKLIEEAKRLGLAEKDTRTLIKAYGEIDPNVTTVYKTKGFGAIYDELQKLQFAQFALAKGLDPKAAAAMWRQQKQGGYAGDPRLYKAAGGYISGPGTAVSDSIPAWLSNGEFVQPAKTVDYYGRGLMEAIRRRLLPRDMFPGYARGGEVSWPYNVTVERARIPSMDEVRRAVVPESGKPTSGGIGSADMMRILRRVFPGLPLYSGYRPGSRTSSGSLSYHAMTAADGDRGRAVDIPPRRDVFNFIHDHFRAATKELIWLGDAARNIWNGRYHRYSRALLLQHGTSGMPNAHIHWAYDSGGMLPPGASAVVNATGRPEPVLTDSQWQAMFTLARNAHAEARVQNVYNFKEAALDHARLRAIEDRQNAQARVGRPG